MSKFSIKYFLRSYFCIIKISTDINNDGIKVASNNIFLNGSVAYPGNQEPANQINVNPEFVSVPTFINGSVDISQINLQLLSNSPAIDAGNPNYSPALDFNGNPRPSNVTDAISYSSFENSTDGWTDFGGATIEISEDTSLTGAKSLFITGRTLNYSSPRLFLDGLLTVDETYTFYVNVKLAVGVSMSKSRWNMNFMTSSDSHKASWR